MSLRIIIKPGQIQDWVTTRNGVPARKHGSDAELRILFGGENSEFEPITIDELIEAMKFRRLALLVDQEAGNTFHRFVERG
jgi:hypothetical protein